MEVSFFLYFKLAEAWSPLSLAWEENNVGGSGVGQALPPFSADACISIA